MSLPKALDAAELEAAYRFFRNEAVTPSRILEPHISATANGSILLHDIGRCLLPNRLLPELERWPEFDMLQMIGT